VTATDGVEMPADKRALVAKATRLEWLTIAYLLSAIFFIYLTLGSSQAMKTAWFEDIISLVPAIAFLVAARVRRRAPTEQFPYGFHRSVSIAYLCASLALFAMGTFLLYDSVSALLSFEHPSIGSVQIFGAPIWLGWLMLPALVWSGVPAAIIGRAKLPLAAALHDKVLLADAKMNKADWLTATAALVGVLGIGLGMWWADAVAASVISLDILHDGISNLRTVVADLMNSKPTTVDHSAADPLPTRIENELKKRAWVADARVRMREEGHVFFGEAFVVPADDRDLTARIEDTTRDLQALDWRLHELVITPVHDLDRTPAPEGRSPTRVSSPRR
jgi:cation diffusion facilitator family transporter